VETLVDFLGEYGWLILAVLIIALGMALGVFGTGLNIPGVAVNAAAMVVYIMTSMWGLPGALEVWQSVVVFAFGAAAAQSIPALGVAGIPVVVAVGMAFLAIYTFVTAGVGWLLFGYVCLSLAGMFVSLFILSPDWRIFLAALGTSVVGVITAFAPAIPGLLAWFMSLFGIGGGIS